MLPWKNEISGSLQRKDFNFRTAIRAGVTRSQYAVNAKRWRRAGIHVLLVDVKEEFVPYSAKSEGKSLIVVGKIESLKCKI